MLFKVVAIIPINIEKSIRLINSCIIIWKLAHKGRKLVQEKQMDCKK